MVGACTSHHGGQGWEGGAEPDPSAVFRQHFLSPPQASSCSGKLRILRWACRRYCCCLKYTLNAPLMATKAMPPWWKGQKSEWSCTIILKVW